MSKTLAILLAGAFAAGSAIAQQNPPGSNVPPATPGVGTSAPQQKAEMRKDARAPGEVALPREDTKSSTELNPIGAGGKAAKKGQARVEKRTTKHPHRKQPTPGATPK